MRRRDVAIGAAAAAITGPAATQNRVRRIGILWPTTVHEPLRRGLIDSLFKAGAVEGRDFVLLTRGAAGDREKLPRLARELVAEGAEVILTTSNATRHVLRASAAVRRR